MELFMFVRFFSLVLVISTFVSMNGCGRKAISLDKPESKKLIIPDQTESEFTLDSFFDSYTEKKFLGSFVIWDPKIRAQSLANLLEATKNYNESVSSSSKYINSELETKILPLKQSYLEKKKVVDSLRLKTRSEDIQNASVWFNSELSIPDVLSKIGGEEGYGAAGQKFERYCEAKVVEFAISDFLVTSQFLKRPTPAALCESVYKKLGLFEFSDLNQENVSECSDSPVGKSYFKCFWVNGVLKTSFAKFGYSEAQISQLSSAMNEDKFKNMFDPNGEKERCSAQPPTANSPGKICDCSQVKNWFLTTKRPSAKVVTSCNGYPESSLKMMLLSKQETDFLKASVGDFITSFEDQAAVPNGSIRMIPIAETDNVALEMENKIKSKIFNLQGKNRIDTTVGSTSRVTLVTESSIRFNISLLPSAPSFRFTTAESTDLPDIFSKNPDLLEAEIQLGESLNIKNSKLNGICSVSDDKKQDAFMKKLELARAKDVTLVLVRQFEMSVSRSSIGKQVALNLALDGSNFGQVCFSSFKNLQVENCNSDVKLSSAKKLDISVYEQQRKLVLRTQMDSSDVSKFGDGGDVITVREVVKEQFPGKSLEMELYFNKLDSYLPYWSGNIKVYDGSKEVFKGSASYLLDTSLSETGILCEAYR
jgi:hypothetical protein